MKKKIYASWNNIVLFFQFFFIKVYFEKKKKEVRESMLFSYKNKKYNILFKKIKI